MADATDHARAGRAAVLGWCNAPPSVCAEPDLTDPDESFDAAADLVEDLIHYFGERTPEWWDRVLANARVNYQQSK